MAENRSIHAVDPGRRCRAERSTRAPRSSICSAACVSPRRESLVKGPRPRRDCAGGRAPGSSLRARPRYPSRHDAMRYRKELPEFRDRRIRTGKRAEEGRGRRSERRRDGAQARKGERAGVPHRNRRPRRRDREWPGDAHQQRNAAITAAPTPRRRRGDVPKFVELRRSALPKMKITRPWKRGQRAFLRGAADGQEGQP